MYNYSMVCVVGVCALWRAQLKHFEFAGKVVGKCLYESALGGAYRQLVRARLARSFLAQLIGLRVHYKVLLSFIPNENL